MLNEWQEFLDYTGPVTYTGNKSKDTSYMGRFTFKNILEFEGMPRVLTIIARGYMYHDRDGNILGGVTRGSGWTMFARRYAPGAVCRRAKKPLRKRSGRIRVILKSCMRCFTNW